MNKQAFLPIIPFLLFFQPVTANENEDKRKLATLQEDIRQLQSSIKNANDEKAFLTDELLENEKSASAIRVKLDQVNKNIASKVAAIRKLQAQKNNRQQDLIQQRSSLAQQIRAAYMSGRSDYLKLWLNQEDPQQIGRVLAYYDYHNRQRTDEIKTTTAKITEIETIEAGINEENRELIVLKDEQETFLADLEHSRQMRQSILENLDRFITEQGNELQRLRYQEQELKTLLKNIDENSRGGIQFFEDIAPFDTLQGALEWPVKGHIRHQFGSPKKGANLNWQGIYIDVDAGTEVKAVSTGKVVFADWFKNLGLLVIIEHGDGYMSLYGHNQSISKKQGDWVLPGEPIAEAGDTGGQPRAGLYFELRHRGKPLNPVRWCRK